MIKKIRKSGVWLIPMLSALAVYYLLKYVFLFGYVPTASMEPTLEAGSYILGFRLYDSLEVGDVVIFEHDGQLLVKRIAASEGSTVVHKGSILTVPEGSYYMLGDNVANSYDSRYWDNPFVKECDIKAILVLHWGLRIAPMHSGYTNPLSVLKSFFHEVTMTSKMDTGCLQITHIGKSKASKTTRMLIARTFKSSLLQR